VRRYGIIGGTHDDVLKLMKKLQAAHPGTLLKFCYEAGPRGYPLCRFIRAHGCECMIVSPSKVPRKPGDRVKTDRRDADQLARLFRAGELTGIYVPDPQDEAVRDLIRARYQVQKQQHRARQQFKMFLLRQNIRYARTTSWTPAHLRFLATIKMPFAEQQFVFQERVNVISEAGQRLERYEAQLPGVVAGWRWAPVVRALMSLRGVALLTAATLVAELGDLERFATAGQLMSYLGLVPSEHTTSQDRQQGGITKLGNGIARRALIEAAWHYRMPARISRGVLARQEGLPKAVTDAAWAAQTRLYHRYKHLVGTGRKKPQVAAAALGRELSGFVWAIGRMVKPHAPKV
jgi:transposase